MTQNQRLTNPTGVFYAEDHSAIRWPYYANLIVWVLVLAAGIWMTSVSPSMSFVPAIGTLGVLVTVVIIAANFRTGIEISADGIRIGAVNHTRRQPRRSLPWGDAQRKEVFFSPWDAEQRAAVITDRAALKSAARLRNPGVKLGVLWAPFAKAALVIEIDSRSTVFPAFREPDQKRPIFRPYHPGPFTPSPIWYAPTKRPDELRRVLAQHVAPPRTDAGLSTHPYLFDQADVTRP